MGKNPISLDNLKNSAKFGETWLDGYNRKVKYSCWCFSTVISYKKKGSSIVSQTELQTRTVYMYPNIDNWMIGSFRGPCILPSWKNSDNCDILNLNQRKTSLKKIFSGYFYVCSQNQCLLISKNCCSCDQCGSLAFCLTYLCNNNLTGGGISNPLLL